MTAIEDHPYKVAKQANNEDITPDIEENTQDGKSFSTGILDIWEDDQVEEPSAHDKVWNAPHIPADKPVFTLSVAADLLGLHPRTLRLYEEKQLVVPARTTGNRRCYSPNDIERFQSIRKLTSGGVNLEGVRIILDMADELARLGGDPNTLIERNLGTADNGPRTTDD
jgi:MerR family transcriptional regulator/heat shock protein HspR